ncbi:hypothetical protein [Streptomyces sp. NBC_00878]|uniref:hypothetical protein n=1 Tax=Streptomyces sp. NBC_00878 TaxID=2975854 RepID=UPI0022560937|nr:hypothetical protein [Streptomyces sp. NBC_00878]MCX4911868.1 hypothetical protein [Streptomyces sp. NBC_00878]
MGVYIPPFEQHDNVIKAALRVILGTHYARDENPHADAEQEYGREQLALAARELAEAVERKPADEQPIGWAREGEKGSPADEIAVLREQVERVREWATSHEYKWLHELLDGAGTHGGHL